MVNRIYTKTVDFFILYQNSIILFAIVLFGFGLRIWGIWNVDNQDEYNEVFEALRVCSGHLNFERWGKRFYLYVLSVAYGFYYLIGMIFHVFDSPLDFAAKVIRNLDPLLFIGRSISAIFGTATIYLTYKIGRSLFDSTVGIIAALFVCTSAISIEVSHYATVDATLSFTVMISFYFITRLLIDKDNPSIDYILAGLFSGIAFQNKVPALILIVPFLLSHAFRSNGNKIWQNILCKEIGYYVLSYLLGLVVGNPAILFAPHKFLIHFFGYTRVLTSTADVLLIKPIGYVTYLLFFYKELGILFCALISYSLFKSTFSRNKAEWLILSFIVPFYLVVGASRLMVFNRYMVPLIPFLFILCSKYLVQIVQNLQFKPNRVKSTLVILSILLLIQPFIRSAKYERLVSDKDTKILAKEWIEKNIAFGSKILMDSGKSFNTIGPKIHGNKESIMRRLNQQKEAIQKNDSERTAGKVDKNALIYYELLMKTVSEDSYDITSTNNGLEVKDIDYYISNKFQYMIIVKSIKDRSLNESFRQKYPSVAEFYKSIDAHQRLELIKKIGPTSKNRGHTYLIYKLIPGI
jgi:4-amino-4-deoxy-L-arabinose transferase-like glycosyltransferase